MNYRAVNGVLRHLEGYKPDDHDPRDIKLKADVLTTTPTPPHFDLLGAAFPPVGDQGTLGTCVANAACEAVEYLERKAGAWVLYSRLYVYFWARALELVAPTDDSGCHPRSAIKVLAERGVPSETDWPYDNALTRFSVEPPASVDAMARTHRALLYYSCPNLYTLKASIKQGFPVIFGVRVFATLFSIECAQTGNYAYPAQGMTPEGGHCMLALGWDDRRVIGAQTGAIRARNSWGAGYGDAGDIWIPYRYFQGDPGTVPLARDMWTIRWAEV